MMCAPESPKYNTYFYSEKERGFTLFELAVVASIIAMLVSVLMHRISSYQEEAELVAVERLVATLRSALIIRTGALLVANQQRELPTLLEQNPIAWLTEKPRNYLGEYYSPDIKKFPRGNWYYDRSAKMLVYLLNNGKTLSGGWPNLLKFKLKLHRLPAPSAKPSGVPSEIEGIALDEAANQAAIVIKKNLEI